MVGLPSRYNPADVEQRLYQQWESQGLFHAEPDSARTPYTIVIPPPNVTGILHMGHALNNAIQDICIRFKRMQGANALWVPGTDHAGIATQNVVEKQLAKERLRRQDLGREKFLERVWQWKEQYGNTIIRQLKRLGASCDWTRTRFTMDEGLSEAVAEVFVRLYEKGLIYRGNYIINWCPRCQTALSDEEAPRKETHGKLYYIKYPLIDITRHTEDRFIVVATTRPETMLGDTAVAVHPKDKRYKHLIGKTVMLPIVQRPLRIIADELVDPEFGTGAVKVTPAHDPVDFQLANRHRLEIINIMTDDARMVNVPERYTGKDRFECRKQVLEDLEGQGAVEKVADHLHAVGHCYRCDTVIEPRLSLQWFVKMKPLAKPAIDVVKKRKVTFTPSRWTKVYLNWMENIQDWCISRQIWWGHRLPVYYCQSCQTSDIRHQISEDGKKKKVTPHERGVIVSKTRPTKCPICGNAELKQDEDVLDTWFSSWLWPFSTLGWPKKTKDLGYFYPTDTLVTAPEIIFFWVARMMMAGLFCMKEIPFRQVYIHGTVRDLTGKKMSKSLGNIIDPLDIIDQFGADALRYTLVTSTAVGTDVFISEEKFVVGRNFANKLWNAARFLNSTDPEAISRPLPKPSELKSQEDEWILTRLQHTVGDVTKDLEDFRFNEAANAIYDFFWHDICDWYLELNKMVGLAVSSAMEKLDIQSTSTEDVEFHQQAKISQAVLAHVLSTSLRLLHPFMPFITEELWTRFKSSESPSSIMRAPWPVVDKRYINQAAERQVTQYQTITKEVRHIRQVFLIDPSKKPKVFVKTRSEKEAELIKQGLKRFLRLGEMEIGDIGTHIKRPAHSIPITTDGIESYVSIGDSVDMGKAHELVTMRLNFSKHQLQSVTSLLSNRDFSSKAPSDIIEREKSKKAELESTIRRFKDYLAALT